MIGCIHRQGQVPGHAAPRHVAGATADQAYEILNRRPTLCGTNQGDKEIQLAKLKPLNEKVQPRAFAEMGAQGSRA